MTSNNQLLKDPNIFPSDKVIEDALGIKAYAAFKEMLKSITNNDFGLNIQWTYYNDGKAWLCKVTHKKKTVFWLSIGEQYFKTTFYFTQKNSAGVLELEVSESIKIDFKNAKTIGKLIPLTLTINCKEQLSDLLKIADYKKNLK